MKRILQLLLALLISTSAIAQPDGETFPDFTYTDLEGVTHNLQTYLDQGKTVVIDVFATWCPNCQQSVGGWESLYNLHGQGGDETMVLLSFERDASTSNEAQYISMYGIESPVITEAEDVIDELWNITYQPRYFVICPDGSFEYQGTSPIYNNPQPLIDLADNCEEIVGVEELEDINFSISNSNNVDVLNYQMDQTSVNFEIFNLLGSQISSGQLENSVGQISIAGLQSGVYLIRLSTKLSSVTLRFVKR
ncbi:MAG: thiol-disulfide isomerase/thioredoxin [Patiriisocius sp.]|jgi:thiol-disulfide isomerase/thioredoxin